MSAAADGPVVVLTGASDGIGAAAARRLHRSGVRVVVVGRSPEKTAAIAGELGVPSFTADFRRLDDVRRLAGQLRELLPRIDVLVDNAGASFPRRELTADGVERTFQVDHLAPYLLTRLLEEPLRAAAGRVVVTSSFAHLAGAVRRGRLDRVADPGGRLPIRAYATAKWANVLFAGELARRWAPEVTAVSFDPGAVASSFGRVSGGFIGALFSSPLVAFARTPAQGADTLVWLATADSGWRNGALHADRRRRFTAPSARDGVRARELWEVSARLVGLPA